MFFTEPQSVTSNEEVEQPVEQEASEDSPKDQPYKRPDYKKRYDDLKKHYDTKLSEFKSREQELLEEATKNRQTYKAPKSQEEL